MDSQAPTVDPVPKTEGGGRQATEAIATQAATAEPTTNDIVTTAGPSGTEDAVADLSDALAGIQTQGTFASFHPLKRVDPDLSVQDVGPVSLPPSEPVVRQLIDKAIRAPFGKGSETIVDTSVRNTWELDPSQFELRSPRWPADFTEKCPDMFGTLVIYLPCGHKGGDVVVKHCGETKTFKTSAADQSFACWYSDVHHEVLPVTEGYRVVLTYNLAIDPAAPRPSAGLRRQETRDLRHTLRRWLEDPDAGEVDHVYYGLDHEYSEASISMKALKGRDAAVVQTLQELSAGLEFDVLLALTEKMEMGPTEYEGNPRYSKKKKRNRRGQCKRRIDPSGGFDGLDGYDSCGVPYEDYASSSDGFKEDPNEADMSHEIEDVTDESLSVKVLVDLSGRPILRNIRLKWRNVLDATEFFEGVERQEEYEGYQGNWAALIIRRDKIPSFLKAGTRSEWDHYQDDAVLLDYLTDSILKALTNRKSSFETLKYVWDASVPRPGSRTQKAEDEILSKVLPSAVAMKDWDFFEKVSKKRGEKELGEPLSMFRGWHFFEIFEAVKAFAPTDQPLSDEIREWARAMLTKGVKDTADSAIFVRQDGLALVTGAEKYADFDWLSSVAMPLIKELLVHTPAFALDFLSALLSCARRKTFPVARAVKLYKWLAKEHIAMLDVEKVHGRRRDDPAHKAARHIYGQTVPSAPDHRLALTHVALADLFSGLIKLALLVMPPKMHAIDFPVVWIPLLRELLATLEATKTPLNSPRYQQLFAAVFEAYRDNHVGSRPVRPPSSQLGGGMYLVQFCTCGDCSKLDNFLVNPAQTSLRLVIGAKKQRHHVHKVIEERGIRVTHETERFAPGGPTMVINTVGQTDVAKQQGRAKEAEEAFQVFDQTKLGVLLGEDYPAMATALWQRPVNLVPGVTYPPAPIPAPAPVAAPTAAPVPAPVPAPGPAAAGYVPPGNTIVPAVGPAWVSPPTNRHQPMIGSARGPPPSHFNTSAAGPSSVPPPMSGAQPMNGPMDGPRPINGPAPVPTVMPSGHSAFAPTTGNARKSSRPPPSSLNTWRLGVAAAPGPSQPPPPVAAVKRKAEPEIIDLT
ncbi:2OG-Fe(II)oxygenase superfamily protein [Colletotrichum salicis]|uniref:2OG-Fe(II)oxygenase superfamily protein n=1 Tax=Colletotrichum salicis TaxID=1209931 RepID=A0A135T2V3_9PEZI|nr:2OG-Fe(II)oxygenase superfamily protein [Colletotrichum salicis]